MKNRLTLPIFVLFALFTVTAFGAFPPYQAFDQAKFGTNNLQITIKADAIVGTNVLNDTLNSNKFDQATRDMFGTGGGGTNGNVVAAGALATAITNGNLVTISADDQTNTLGSAARANVADFAPALFGSSPIVQANIQTNNLYEAFPILATTEDGDQMHMVFFSSTEHLNSTNGVLRHSVSYNAGLTWSDPAIVVDERPIEVRNHAYGIIDGNRHIIAYLQIDGAFNPIGLAQRWSDDGTNWYNGPAISTNGLLGGYGSFSSQIKQLGNRIYMGGYDAWTNGAGTGYGTNYAFVSTDRGTNWSRFVIWPSGDYNETAILPVTEEVVVAVSRIYNTANFGVFYSTNGATNWLSAGHAGLQNSGPGNLPSLSTAFNDDGQHLVLGWGYRPFLNIYFSSLLLTEVLNNPRLISSNRIDTGVSIGPNTADGGYVSFIPVGNGSAQFVTAYYESSGAGSTSQGSNAWIKVAVLPADTASYGQVQAQNLFAKNRSGSAEFRLMPPTGTAGAAGVNYNGGLWFGPTNAYSFGYTMYNDTNTAAGQFWLYARIAEGFGTNARGFAVTGATTNKLFWVGDSGQAGVAGTFFASNGITGPTSWEGLLKADSGGTIGPATIGTGLTFDGTTLAATGSGSSLSNIVDTADGVRITGIVEITGAGDSTLTNNLTVEGNVYQPNRGNTYNEFGVDEFLGTDIGQRLGWTSAAVNGTASMSTALVPGHPGIYALWTGSVTNSAPYLTTGINFLAFFTNDVHKVSFWFRTPAVISDNTDDYQIRVGFSDATTTNYPVDAAILMYNHNLNSGNWVLWNASNSSSNLVNTSVAYAANTWLKVTVEADAANSRSIAYIADTAVATNTGSLPMGASRAVGLHIQNVKTAGTSDRQMFVDAATYSVTVPAR